MTIDGLPVTELTGTGVLVAVAILVITRKLVWYTDLRKVEKREERWQGIALQALGVADKLTIQAELTNEVLTRLPDPAAGKDVRSQ